MKKPINVLLAVALLSLLCSTRGTAESSHDLLTDRIVVEDAVHWQNWAFAEGTVDITAAGEVRANKLSGSANAVLDIADFLRRRPPDGVAREEIGLIDAIQAGSNRADVLNLLDGDMETYWEPDMPASGDFDIGSRWWFTIDLGRVVLVDRIVLRFVAADRGDPFLLFDVLTSDGQKPVNAIGGSDLDFTPVLQTQYPNKTQRLFEQDLSDSGPQFRAQVARYVQVVVRGSAFDRAHEVSPEEYDSLPEADRGLIEYTNLLPDGGEVAVPRDVHEGLNDDRRGPIRFFRRERPRLAELEVWGSGDEIVEGTIARGGHISNSTTTQSGDILADGKVETTLSVQVRNSLKPNAEILMDLGAFFWIDSQAMITDLKLGPTLSSYQLDFSDGSREADGSFKWHTPVRVEQKVRSPEPQEGTFPTGVPLVIDRHFFEPVKARFFRLFNELERTGCFSGCGVKGNAQLAEIQLFGLGFQPQVSLESGPIDLSGRNLTSVEWESQTPHGTQVVLQTKTGNTLNADTLYYKNDGEFLGRGEPGSKKYYSRAYKKSQGEKKRIFEEDPDWSPWSPHYENPEGSPIVSPSPRLKLKIRATLFSDTPDTTATLESIRLHFADPVADRLIGEVTPARVGSLGVALPYALFLKPEFADGNPGFDQLLLTGGPGLELNFRALYRGAAADLTDDEEMNGNAVESVRILAIGDSLHLAFPAVEPTSDQHTLRLNFTGTLFGRGGQLQAFVRRADADEEAAWQQVDPGDAVDQVESNSLMLVALPRSKQLLGHLQIQPPVFTPNDDGTNDQVALEFDLFLVGESSEVEAAFYDMSGRLVRTLREQRKSSVGSYTLYWDGVDDTGRLVPPGNYLVRVSVDASIQHTGVSTRERLGVVGVAY